MKILLFIIGIICELYGLAVLAIIGAGHWFNFCFIIIGAALFCLAVFLKRIKKTLKKMPKLLREIILVIIAMCFFTVASFEIHAVKFGMSVPSENADYVIVLGAKVNGTTPSREFAVRIDAAADYWKKNSSAKIIVTGGRGGDEGIAESLAAKERLIRSGVPEEKILAEQRSISTYGNLVFASDLIKEDGGDVAKSDVVIVSSSFHLYRSSMYAKKAGYGKTSYLGCTGLRILVPQYYAREFAAVVSDRLRGELLYPRK